MKGDMFKHICSRNPVIKYQQKKRQMCSMYNQSVRVEANSSAHGGIGTGGRFPEFQ